MVENMFHELFRMKDIPDDPDSLFRSGELSFMWKQNDGVVPIPGDLVGGSLADLINTFKTGQVGQNEMVVTCGLTVE